MKAGICMIKQKGSMIGLLVVTAVLGMLFSSFSVEAIPSSGWGTAEQIETTNLGSALDPQVAVDGSGNAIAVWYQFDGTRDNVWSNRYVVGTGWGTATLIETDDLGPARFPQVAVDGSGNAIAVWQQHDGAIWKIYSNRYVVGEGWGTATLIDSDNSEPAYRPEVTVDGSGNAIAVWYQHDGTRNNMWSNRYVIGTGWGTATLIETDNSGSAYEPKVAVDGSGNAIAVWKQNDGTRDNIWSNRYVVGTGWGTATLIETDNTGNAWTPEVAVDGSGNGTAVWLQYDSTSWNIYSNRYVVGTGWGTATLLETDNSGTAKFPEVAVDGSGNAIAVWQQSDGTRNNILSNRYVIGTGWGTATLIETDNSGNAQYPEVAVDGSGNAIAVWYQHDGTRDNIWSNRYVVGMGWGTATLIETSNLGSAKYPQVAVDGSGNAIAVWHQLGSTSWNIYSNRYVKPDTTPPSLSLDRPSDGITTETPTVTASGTTEPDVTLSINGILVEVGSDGSFSCNISLFDGANNIVVTATDAWDNSVTVSRVVTYNDPINSLLEDMVSVLETLSSLDNQLNIITDDMNSTWENLSSLKSELNTIGGYLDSVLENLSSLKSELNTTDGYIDSVMDTIASLQIELDLIGGSLDSIQDDLNSTRDDITIITTSQDSQGSDLDRTEKDLDDFIILTVVLIIVLDIIIFTVMLILFFILKRMTNKKNNDVSEE